MPDPAATRLSSRFAEAVAYAVDVHADQVRKQPRGRTDRAATPYVAHLLGVASLILEAGGDEDLAIAGLLHDAAEDHGGWSRLADIRERFGPRVARIVEDCSDSLEPEESGKAPWEVRKREHLARLADADLDALTVWAADKVHNGRAIVVDVVVEGPAAMSRFHALPDRVLWYYQANLALLSERGAPSSLLVALAAVVADLTRLLDDDSQT